MAITPEDLELALLKMMEDMHKGNSYTISDNTYTVNERIDGALKIYDKMEQQIENQKIEDGTARMKVTRIEGYDY